MKGKTKKSVVSLLMGLLSALLVVALLPIFPGKAHASGTLNVPITVKESSGANSSGFPVTTVVPLPYGQYQDTSSFRVTDAAGNTVPAQFDVLNRQWSKDNSIRHLTVQFQPTVSANGSETYYLRDDGTGNTSSSLSVTETSDSITVNTGPLQFTVNKQHFNLFDSVTLNGESLITSDPGNGGALVDRFNQTQYDAAMAAPVVTIEESGPLRTVIRAELPAKFRLTGQYANYQPGIDKINVPLEQGDYTHDHGYIVRIYAYAGKSYVKTDYSLANSDKSVLTAWPLYFDDFSLNFQMPMAWNNVKIGGETSTYDGTVDSGKYVYTYDDTTDAKEPAYVIKDGTGADLAADTTVGNGNKAPGWMDLSGTSSGMMVSVKNFWQTWPNGLQVDSGKKVSVRLFPKWGQGSYWNSNNVYTQTTTGLYWLEDMQHITKSMLFYFHGNETSSSLNDLSKLFQKEPVGTLPVDWYRTTSVTFDKGGTIPIDTKRPSLSNTNVDLSDYYLDMNNVYYDLGYNNYLGDAARKHSDVTGDVPYSVANFASTENPKYYYTAEAMVLSGTMNTRPQWLSGYTYDTGAIYVPSLNNSFYPVDEAPYGYGSWRMRWPIASAGTFKPVAPYLPGTDVTGWDARDFAHMWFYENEEFYYYSGDKLIYDWYKFIGEMIRTNIEGTPNEPFEFADGDLNQTRALGHELSTLMSAYRIVGDPTFLATAKDMVNKLAKAQFKYGGFDNNDEGYQLGYLATGLINFMEEMKGSDDQEYETAFGILNGIIEFNANYLKYGYYIKPNTNQDEAYVNTAGSSGTSSTFLDAEAWWYLHTGDVRVLNNVKAYIAGEYGAAPYGMPTSWNGDYLGRVVQEAFQRPKADETPPTAITNLTVTPLGGGQVRLDWTGPADAANYHVRWSTSPISGKQTQDDGKTNWWKANAVGNTLSGSGAQTLTVSGIPDNAIVYFAVRSFDANENMSEISNVASAVIGTGDSAAPATVANLSASGTTGFSTALSWTSPGDDGTTGAASQYDIRYSTAPITDVNWSQAVPVADVPAPRTAGRSQSMTVNGLSGNTTYYFAMKSVDDASHMSGISNTVSVTTGAPDVTPPSTVTLSVYRRTSDSVTLSWTAPGSDGTTGDAAYRYDVRYSTAPITDANWDNATPATGAPVPATVGTAQSMAVSGLSANTDYYFAMKTRDQAYNDSALSNVVQAGTTPVNIALNKPGITTSMDVLNKPVDVLTDGNIGKDGFMRLAGGPQWVQVDLGQPYSIASLNLLHQYTNNPTFHDVIVQLSNDPTFATGVTKVFNNDADNSAKQGIGTDAEYAETSAGKDIDLAQPITARYVRTWASGNTTTANGSTTTTGYSDFIELSVYGSIIHAAPSTPTNVKAIAGAGQVTVSWSASAGAESYNVKRGTVSGGPYTTVASSVTATSYTDPSVTNGTAYYYAVSAVNTVGESANSAEAAGTPNAAAPSVPTNVTASASAGQVTVGWSASPGSVSYNVKRSTVSGGPYTTVASGVTATSYTDTSVSNGTTYYYVVSTVNAGGESANSTEASATPTTSNGAAFNRTGWTATASTSAYSPAYALDGDPATHWASSQSQIPGLYYQVNMGSAKTFNKITLDAGSSSGQPIGYEVYVSADGSNWGSPVASGAAGSDAVMTITFPTQTAQYIKVVSTGTGPGWWNLYEFNVYNTVVPAPTGITSSVSAAAVQLSWNASSGAASYNVKRSTVSGGPYTTVASGVTATSYTDTSVTNGSTYYYVVSAVNAGGESANSAETSATLLSGAALNRTGWTATASNSGYSPAYALDGDPATHWASSQSQIPGLY